jgi:uncharacterized membrane protein
MSRIQKIDFIRGIATILMIIFHSFSLIDVKKNTFYTQHPYFFITGYLSRIIFIFLLGFSFKLSNTNNITNTNIKIINKILLMSFLSLLITLITYLQYPDKFVKFGILHFLTISLLLLLITTKINENIPLISGIIMFIIFLLVINKKSSSNVMLNIIGFSPTYDTMDIFPIFKWFWLVGLGYFFASKIKIQDTKIDNKLFKSISYIGQKSLIIYVLHFPIIFSIHKLLKIY